MITNDRQYRITKSQLRGMKEAADAFDFKEAGKRAGSTVLAKAELAALQSEVEVLSEQIREYEALKSGAVTVLRASSLEEVPTVLIRARIAKGLSQRELAGKLGMKEQQIQRYEAEAYSSASLHRLAEVADALDLNVTEIAQIGNRLEKQSSGQLTELDWSMFPVKEMYRRNWFPDFTGSLSAALACADELVQQFLQEAMPRRQPALLRQRARIGGNTDTYALLAWQCRILMLSQVQDEAGSFQRTAMTKDWFAELVKMSRLKDGPRKAREFLRSSGIALVFEPHLPQTYLDGAVFLVSKGGPVIGMTLRYDRLDNFWFVLLHELAHIVKHLRRGKLEDIFDDLEAEDDDIEREADAFAGARLISDEAWEMALARYDRTRESIETLATELSINPAIVAGRIRNEAKNFIILSDMVGQGEVRSQFPEVRFGQ